MSYRLYNPFLTKFGAAIIAAMLCLSVLGVQAVGLFHGVVHASSEHQFQLNNTFADLEKGVSSSPQKSRSTCKLLDSLLLGVSLTSDLTNSSLVSFSQVTQQIVLGNIFALFVRWPYQAQAPPPPISSYS